MAQVGISALLIIIALLTALLFSLLKQNEKSIFEKYEFNRSSGFWQHKENKGDRICGACKPNNIFSPLFLDCDDGLFHCPKCDKTFQNDPIVIYVNL